jgi:hypothetical protein
VDDLHRLAVDLVERGPQRLVPGAHAGDRGGQRVRPQWTPEPQRETAVVGRPLGLERVQEPQPLLRERQRHGPAAVHLTDRVRLPGRAGAAGEPAP